MQSGKQTMGQWAGRLDMMQSLSGFILALFMWVHMFLVSSILISNDAMYMVAKLFEGYYVFGRAYPQLVSMAVFFIFSLMMLHALLAMRKFPHDLRQYRVFRKHQLNMQHTDTTLWWWQVVTGFLLFFFAPMHLFGMFSEPDQIGPYASAWRVYSTHWPLYLILLFVVEVHGAVGLYRLLVKWVSLPMQVDPKRWRRRLSVAKWSMSVFFIALGLATLGAYYHLGANLQDNPGQRYVPAAEHRVEVNS